MAEENIGNVINKQKEFQRNAAKLQHDAAQYRQKAKDALIKNRIDEAKIYAQQSCSLYQYGQYIKTLAAKLECAAASMKMGMAVKDAATVIEDINKELYVYDVNPVYVATKMAHFNDEMQKMNANMQYMEGCMDSNVVVDKKAEDLISQMKAELGHVDFNVTPVQNYQSNKDINNDTMRRLIEDVNNM